MRLPARAGTGTPSGEGGINTNKLAVQSASRRDACLRLPCLALAAVLAPPFERPAFAISATTMSGKAKPELGLILPSAAAQSGSTISAETVLPSGKLAKVSYDSKYPLVEGGYYDVETMAKEGGDGAFVQVATLPKGADLGSLKKDWFLQTICSVTGRYGSYGAPIDAKVLSDDKGGSTRTMDIAFTVLSPSMAEIPRRAVVSATQPAGSSEVVMLVSGCSTTKWKKGGEAPARAAASSFQVAVRPTDLKYAAYTDYRYGKTSGPSNMSSRNDDYIALDKGTMSGMFGL